MNPCLAEPCHAAPRPTPPDLAKPCMASPCLTKRISETVSKILKPCLAKPRLTLACSAAPCPAANPPRQAWPRAALVEESPFEWMNPRLAGTVPNAGDGRDLDPMGSAYVSCLGSETILEKAPIQRCAVVT